MKGMGAAVLQQPGGGGTYPPVPFIGQGPPGIHRANSVRGVGKIRYSWRTPVNPGRISPVFFA